MRDNLLFRVYKKEMFNPGLIGLLVNPFFIIRRGLFKGIKLYAPQLSGKMLDFGCGRKPYKSLFEVDEYIGLDIEDKGHPHKNSLVDVFYDGNTIPFPDAEFDSIFSSEVFEHVFNIDEVLVELNRVCKPGGKLLITVPFVWDEHEIPYDYGRYSSFGISHLLSKHGFRVLEHKKSNGYVSTIFQMWNAYVHQYILRIPFFQILLNPILVMPFTLLGLILNFLLPGSSSFFHNNIVLAEKA